MIKLTKQQITDLEGSDEFPTNENDVLTCVEVIAKQDILALKSANKLNDAVKTFEVENGKVLETAVIKMAEARAFDKDSFSRAPLDPTLAVKYHNNFEEKQYQTTVRKNDIRKIIANKGVGVEEVAGEIISTLTEGEGHDDYVKTLNLMYSANFKDFTTIYAKKPKNMKGVLYMIRKMYNHLKHDNNDLTEHDFISSTKESDIRIAFSTDVSNLIDVVELASILHLEKEALMGKINLFDVSYDSEKNPYMIFVYDVNALGKATRLYVMETEHVARGLYDNAYLTIDKCFYHSGLFKGCKLDVTDACEDAEEQILEDAEVKKYKVSVTGANMTTDEEVPVEVNEGSPLQLHFTADKGYHFSDESKTRGEMGGTPLDAKQFYFDSNTGKYVLDIASVTGDVEADVNADAD